MRRKNEGRKGLREKRRNGSVMGRMKGEKTWRVKTKVRKDVEEEEKEREGKKLTTRNDGRE